MNDNEPRRRPDGPPPGILGSIALAFSVAALVAGFHFPRPSASAASTAAYFIDHQTTATLVGFLTFGASVPLGIYAATMYARQLRLGIRVPGPGISFFGGITASILLATSGLITWTLARASAGVPPTVIHLFTELNFALGGIGFAGGMGLLIAGIAVPSVVLRLIPAWLGWTGLALGALGELTYFALLWNGLDVLLPLTRFAGLLWLAAVGFRFPLARPRARRGPELRAGAAVEL